MGVVYTDVIKTSNAIDGSSSAALRADLDAILLASGWTLVRNIANGKVYEGTSPQARVVRLVVQDLGDTDGGAGYIRATFWNAAETVSGAVHPLIYRASRVYSACVCECQLFLWLGTTTLGPHSDGFRGYDFAGGIPYVPESDLGDPCGGGDPLLVNDIFWSCSVGLGGGGSGAQPWGGGTLVWYDYHSFRNNVLCGNPYGAYGVSCGYENGIVRKYGDFGVGVLQLRLVPHAPLRYSTWRRIDNLRAGTNQPLRVEPFIAWDGMIRGQLYNAFIECRQNVAGAEVVDDENTSLRWTNYSYGAVLGNNPRTWYSSLFLLKEPAGSAGPRHYAY